jgi:RimJ/RimL family protein N-acetyltransferase
LIEIEGEVVGAIGLENTEKDHKAELGYWLARKYWGGGIMSQAVEEVVNFGFKDLNLKRIYAKVYSFNEGSKKVLEKNGFTQEGYLKKEAKKGNKYIDAFLFAKIK